MADLATLLAGLVSEKVVSTRVIVPLGKDDSLGELKMLNSCTRRSCRTNSYGRVVAVAVAVDDGLGVTHIA